MLDLFHSGYIRLYQVCSS